MTRLLIEVSFDEGADKQAIVDKVLAMQAAGNLSNVWRKESLQGSSVSRLLVITPDGDDSALKSALWDMAILNGLKEMQVSALLDSNLLLQNFVKPFVRPKAEEAELTSDDCACPKVQR